jgi:hypothetical protein
MGRILERLKGFFFFFGVGGGGVGKVLYFFFFAQKKKKKRQDISKQRSRSIYKKLKHICLFFSFFPDFGILAIKIRIPCVLSAMPEASGSYWNL